MAESDFVRGNDIELLRSGTAFFPALIAAIDAAQSEVRLETYIFADDPTGRRVAAALSAAAIRGVRVHVVVDGFGCSGFMRTLGADMRRDGVEVLVYRPEIARFRLRRHRLRRLHRKLACIDARIAFVGGINIIDDLDAAGYPRLDYAVRIEGPLLAAIHRSMGQLWEIVRWASVGKRYRAATSPVADQAREGNIKAALLVRDNLRHRRSIEDAYLQAIQQSQTEILIANAYFLPGRRFRHALIAAAQRGVKVVLLLEGRVEYYLQYFATQGLYAQLQQAGIEIFEYRDGFLHAKVAVFDGRIATVGSSNIDPFSLFLAREANVLIDDQAFAANLAQDIRTAIESGASRIPLQGKRSRLIRLVAWCAYGAVRALVGLAGYGRQL